MLKRTTLREVWIRGWKKVDFRTLQIVILMLALRRELNFHCFAGTQKVFQNSRMLESIWSPKPQLYCFSGVLKIHQILDRFLITVGVQNGVQNGTKIVQRHLKMDLKSRFGHNGVSGVDCWWIFDGVGVIVDRIFVNVWVNLMNHLCIYFQVSIKVPGIADECLLSFGLILFRFVCAFSMFV